MAVTTIALAGCAGAHITPISLGDGGQGDVVDCSRFDQSMSACLVAANEQCDGRYEILATTGQWNRSAGAASVLESLDRGLLIRCED
ncbi:hypothetical protein [Ectothiorhodospira variabilis]|uniref:hypothetical protein n=1 Tax=Ectothiorhodospira variabilis TaxID=505694 RepID=UPI001EFB3885|nr:hypothetical protein [Ectothiorhodospira variabilis]MCG5495847.1 hypothetical protein [Ectothiorhodospira variabilis]MCG5504548.1 hypothetical protein [Ectothiorhodospira variabilis]MCG5507745.1 hypothetical protein [Ectothiorhodospira variabilis]